MDQTAYCRDKCASSADMMSCVRDCMSRPVKLSSSGPVSPFSAMAPKLFDMEDDTKKRNMLIGAAVAVVAVAGVLYYMKKYHQ